jgi:hypothetical protein
MLQVYSTVNSTFLYSLAGIFQIWPPFPNLAGGYCCAQQTGMHILGCGSTACSVGTVYGGKGHLYTSGVRPTSVATPRRLTVDALLAPWTTPCSPC